MCQTRVLNKQFMANDILKDVFFKSWYKWSIVLFFCLNRTRYNVWETACFMELNHKTD